MSTTTGSPWPHSPGARLGLAVALLVAFGIDLTKLTRNPRLGAGVAIGIGGLGAVALVIWPQVSPALAGVVGAVLIATEFLVYRRDSGR